MYWKELRQSGEIFEYLPEIWQHEQGMPRWFRDSSKTWTHDMEDWRDFLDGVYLAYGLFDDQELTICMYFEQRGNEQTLEMHLSTLRRVAPADFIQACIQLRDRLFRQGVKQITGWLLAKNFVLGRLLRQIGFKPIGLDMDCGESHGRPLRWHLWEAETL